MLKTPPKSILKLLAFLLICNLAQAQDRTSLSETENDRSINSLEDQVHSTYADALTSYMDELLDQKVNPYEVGINKKGMPTYTRKRNIPEGFTAAAQPEEGWLEKSNWQIKCSVVQEKMHEKMVSVQLNVEYFELDSESKAEYYPFYMALVFSNTINGWTLLHEQCVCVCNCSCTPLMSKKEQIIAELDHHVQIGSAATREQTLIFESLD